MKSHQRIEIETRFCKNILERVNQLSRFEFLEKEKSDHDKPLKV